MKILSFNNLNNDICKKLFSVKWLSSTGLDKEFMVKYTKDKYYLSTLKYIVDSKDFSSKTALLLCEKMIKNICASEPQNNLLEKIYKYTLHKSFPDAIDDFFSHQLVISSELYLRIFKVLCEYEKYSNNSSLQSLYPLVFLSSDEIKDLERPQEYNTFLKAFKNDNIYEMMKLNKEVLGYNTIDHICGVHFLAMYIAKKLKELDIPIDLGRVSGAAAGHDIGKYGCRQNELKKVPRLHYYYTDVWFKKHGINYIRNIAINHSTWDLELENLSLESLVLIYCDFRVKNIKTKNGLCMNIFSLKDSFNVILNKLENLDEDKEKRYKKVYAKLKDFEDFLINLGIAVNPSENNEKTACQNSPNYSLLQGNEIVENFKYLSIEHTIKLMHMLRDEYSLDNILDHARSERDWKKLRQYIRIFEEYSTYLTQGQKIQTIKFLYDTLIHPEDDIRRHCAYLIGFLISNLDEEYRKDLPDDVKISYNPSLKLVKEYMDLLLYPSYKFIPKHRTWIGVSCITTVQSLLLNCKENMLYEYRNIILSFYEKANHKNIETEIVLLEMCKYIPIEPYEENLQVIFNLVIYNIKSHDTTLRLCALEASYSILCKINAQNNFIQEIRGYLEAYNSNCNVPSENLLLLKLSKCLNAEYLIDKFKKGCIYDSKKIQNIFLSNLKTATNWINKKNQIEILLYYALDNIKTQGLHTSLHFCNLLKVSDSELVRNKAGEAILNLVPVLSLSEKNEVCVELLRALEIDGPRFTEYIPRYLGQIILYLPPKELDEIIDDFSFKIKVAKPNIKTLILKTISIAIVSYPEYINRFNIKKDSYKKRLNKMLSILLNGIVDYKVLVKQSALTVYGTDIFGSKLLSLREKNSIFKIVAKKLLTLIDHEKYDELLFFTNCIVLNNIYRFMSDYLFKKGEIYLPIKEKIAFFPGTFDPFSLSHKQIARQIRDLGFEVYLSVDEFSWSKRTLPNLVRKKIIDMSIADELDIYVYPGSLQTNIANDKDLKKLKENFKHSEVYIVAGSDVVLNASSYQKTRTADSIHNFSHIIFQRGNTKKLEGASKNICGDFHLLNLPYKYSKISSTQIRNYIDENRDISSLIDPMTEQYIYEYGFYQREPKDKSLMGYYSIDVDIVETINQDIIDELEPICKISREELKNYMEELFSKPSGRILTLRDRDTKSIIGFSSFYWVRSSMLYNELKDIHLSEYLREHSLGRIILIDNLFVCNKERLSHIQQILITETLSLCISKDYEYALYKCRSYNLFSDSMYDLLKLQGFIEIDSSSKIPSLAVNMNNPYVINLDMENILKEPFRSNSKVRNAIGTCRRELQKSLTKLYPGELILSFDCNMTYSSIIKKICTENEVPTKSLKVKKLGNAMCVPYGDLLDRYIIPNTVTKSLHTEKLFYPDMKHFFIGEFPYYLTLKNQVRMMKSFNRPVILVDNLLHKGHRISSLDPLFKNENIQVQKIIVGIMSGRGKDLMDIQNYKVDSVYFMPRLKIWFNETALYPFIGGDSVWRGVMPKRNLIPSVNSIMPYTYPSFINNSSLNSIYNMSKTCIENSLYILSVLEEEFHILEQRNLTLSSLGEVFTIPRCPDHGKDMIYDLNMSASHYLKNDLELLARFKPIVENENINRITSN